MKYNKLKGNLDLYTNKRQIYLYINGCRIDDVENFTHC